MVLLTTFTILTVLIIPNEALVWTPLRGKLIYRFELDVGTPFEWTDCGNGSLPLTFTKISLSPDPVAVPGKAQVSFQAKLTRDVKAPIRVVTSLEKRVGFAWLKIQCINQMGSCVYDDVCPLLERIKCDSENLSDVTCHCPFKKGAYSLPPTEIVIDESVIHYPWSLVRGEYKFQAEASDTGGRVACLHIQFTLA